MMMLMNRVVGETLAMMALTANGVQTTTTVTQVDRRGSLLARVVTCTSRLPQQKTGGTTARVAAVDAAQLEVPAFHPLLHLRLSQI